MKVMEAIAKIDAGEAAVESRRPAEQASASVIVGRVVAICDAGSTPLLLYDGQPGSAALRARTIVPVTEVGCEVVLGFESGDPFRPVILGVLRSAQTAGLAARADPVEIEADGDRLCIAAREQLVLRCGQASITLTRAGKVLIDGAFVQSRAVGANRVLGASVQLN